MLVMLYDNSFEGLLTAVAVAVKSDAETCGVLPAYSYIPNLFDKPQSTITDPEQAERLFSYLTGLGHTAVRLTVNGYLSEEPEVGGLLVSMIRSCLVFGSGFCGCSADASVRALEQISSRVRTEAERLKGLLRFHQLSDGLFYGPFESDTDVIRYLAEHFKTRMACHRWLLHDINRDIALTWDLDRLIPARVDAAITETVRRAGAVPASLLGPDEPTCRQLWRIFHRSIDNRNRRNTALQRRYMPRRYWKYLVEPLDAA